MLWKVKGYISSSHKAKSVIVTDGGLKRASELKRRFLPSYRALNENRLE
jgi:hypothetical protein